MENNNIRDSRHTITLIHAFGQLTFDVDSVRAFGTLENLMESEILQGVPNREKSLTQLWEAVQSLASQSKEAEDVSQTEERLQ